MFKGFKPRQDLVGFTAIPNEWFDEVMAKIDNLSEMKIVQAVFRKTYGWVEGWQNETAIYKLEDEISYSQFKIMTGLSSSSISEGLKKAIAHGYIIQVEAGDFLSGKSSRYRIRMLDDEPQTLEERPKLKGVKQFLPTSDSKSKEAKGPTPSSKAGLTSSSKPSLTSSSKVTIESNKKLKERKLEEQTKQGEDKEVFSTTEFDKKRKPNQYDRYKEKEVKEYNANDLAYYFSDNYERITSVRYSKITNKERSHMKELLVNHGAETVTKGIDYLMKNYRTLISGYPSISVLYGFRTTIIPSAVSGNVAVDKLSVRETKLSEEEIKKASQDTDVIQW